MLSCFNLFITYPYLTRNLSDGAKRHFFEFSVFVYFFDVFSASAKKIFFGYSIKLPLPRVSSARGDAVELSLHLNELWHVHVMEFVRINLVQTN